MELRSRVRAQLAEPEFVVPGREINYSLELLERDSHERAHIRRELALIKEQHGIVNLMVLEVGCGLGQNLEVFKNDNRAIGIEGLPDAVAQARAQGLDVSEGDLEAELAIKTGSTDWVLCLDVLEHLPNPMSLMKEIHRILRARGRVVINVPNHFDLTGRIRVLMGHDLDVHKFFPHNHEWDNPHLRFFTHRGIRQFLRAAGFAVVEDRSERFWSFPKQSILQRIGFGSVLRLLARARPSLFAGGFLLIAEKCQPEPAWTATDS
jgi:SAM-dependent methyltransferase